MAIDQSNVVDFIATDPTLNQVVLIITDHIEWTNNDEENKEHMYFLQQKVNAYLEFAISGEIYKSYPKAVGKDVVMRVMAKFPMSKEATAFFEKVRGVVQKYRYDLQFENPPE